MADATPAPAPTKITTPAAALPAKLPQAAGAWPGAGPQPAIEPNARSPITGALLRFRSDQTIPDDWKLT